MRIRVLAVFIRLALFNRLWLSKNKVSHHRYIPHPVVGIERAGGIFNFHAEYGGVIKHNT